MSLSKLFTPPSEFVKDGKWVGCGHELRAILVCDDPACGCLFFHRYYDFLEYNHKGLCFDCFEKDFKDNYEEYYIKHRELENDKKHRRK